jgi:solute carrier family 10 (sodium/bile acid cotransporter), member 7
MDTSGSSTDSSIFQALRKINFRQQFKKLLEQWFIFGMGFVVLLAWLFPNVARQDGIIKAQITINYGAVACIFLISGLTISTKTLVQMATKWRQHLLAQVMSFLITPSIIFGLTAAIHRANNPNIDPYILVGMIMTGVTPTTVSSNVVMTRQAKGNDSLTLIEVTIENLLGAFISPALVQMFLTDRTGFGYGNPANGRSLTQLYAAVMKQLGIGLFIPLFVGQVLQYIFPRQVKYVCERFKLAKLGSICMLLIIWATFSTAFYQHAFNVVPTASIIMVVFFNLGAYLFFTILCFVLSRIPFHKWISEPTEQSPRIHKIAHKTLTPFYFSRPDTVAMMLVGAAKTVALGIPLIHSQYGNSPTVGRVSIPLVLYQGEQILAAQFLIPVFKRWVESEHAPECSESGGEEFQSIISSTTPHSGAVPMSVERRQWK